MKKSRVAAIALVSVVIIFVVGMFFRNSKSIPLKKDIPGKPAPQLTVVYPSGGESLPPVPTSPQLDKPLSDLRSPRPTDLPQVLEPTAAGQTAWMIAAKNWQNAGRASLGATIQSEYWAIARGEMDYLEKVVVIDEEAGSSLQTLLAQVPRDVRSRYSTPESLAAFFLSSIPALRSMAVGTAQKMEGGDVKVTIHTVEPGADRSGGTQEWFRQSEDGQWLRVIQASDVRRWTRTVQLDRELSKSRIWDISK